MPAAKLGRLGPPGLEQFRHQAGPAGLVRRPDTAARVAVEVLVEQDVVPEMRIAVECPTGSGQFLTIGQVAEELSRRLTRIFSKDDSGRRPVLAYHDKLHGDPHFRDYVLFHEYFHGDNGAGLGASHQTGWTGLVAKLIHQQAFRAAKKAAA